MPVARFAEEGEFAFSSPLVLRVVLLRSVVFPGSFCTVVCSLVVVVVLSAATATPHTIMPPSTMAIARIRSPRFKLHCCAAATAVPWTLSLRNDVDEAHQSSGTIIGGIRRLPARGTG